MTNSITILKACTTYLVEYLLTGKASDVLPRAHPLLGTKERLGRQSAAPKRGRETIASTAQYYRIRKYSSKKKQAGHEWIILFKTTGGDANDSRGALTVEVYSKIFLCSLDVILFRKQLE